MSCSSKIFYHITFAAPSGAPGPLSFSNGIDSTRITIHWEELSCSDRNGEITGYEVETATESSTTQFHNKTFTVSGSNTTRLEIRGLLPGINYTFSVRAVGALEIGPSASASRFIGNSEKIIGNSEKGLVAGIVVVLVLAVLLVAAMGMAMVLMRYL